MEEVLDVERAVTTSMSGRRYRGMTTAERRRDRLGRLLDSALELFGRVGYAQTTIESICQHAGVTARHLYEEFDGREAVLLAVYDRIVDDAWAQVDAAIRDEEGIGLIRAGVGAFVCSILGDERKARVNFVEVVGVSPTVEAHRRAALHRFRDLIVAVAGDLAQSGLIPRRDFHLPAMALVGATQELCVDWTYSRQRPPPQVLVDVLVEVFAGTAGLRKP